MRGGSSVLRQYQYDRLGGVDGVNDLIAIERAGRHVPRRDPACHACLSQSLTGGFGNGTIQRCVADEYGGRADARLRIAAALSRFRCLHQQHRRGCPWGWQPRRTGRPERRLSGGQSQSTKDRFWPAAAGWGSMTEDSPLRTGPGPCPPLANGSNRAVKLVGEGGCLIPSGSGHASNVRYRAGRFATVG